MEGKEVQERRLEIGENDQLDAMLEYEKQKMRDREMGASKAIDKRDKDSVRVLNGNYLSVKIVLKIQN